MNVNDPIRLLIVETSTTEAEACNTLLRSAGVAVRSYYFEPEDDITDLIDKQDPAVILLRHDHHDVTVQDLNSYISTLEHYIPLVVLYDEDEMTELDFGAILNNGASDVVCCEQPEYLSKVVLRSAKYALLERKIAVLERMYASSEARCKSLLHSSKDAIAYVHEGVHVFANLTYLERHGFKRFEDIEGLPLMDLVPDNKQAELKTFLRDLDVSKEEVHHPLTFILEDGVEQEDAVEFSSANMDGESCIQLIIRHIAPEADTSALEEQITKLSTRDQLTGLLNRQAFIDSFSERLERMQSDKNLQFAYFHISIAHFDDHSNALGVMGTETLLKHVSEQLEPLMTDDHPVCRYHAGMFSYLSAVTNHESEAQDIAEYILSCLNSVPGKVDGQTLDNLTFHIGICLVDDPSISVNEAIERGEKALNTASNESPFKIYQPKEGELTQAQLDKAWEAKIDAALKSKRMQINYRPMLNLDGSNDPSYQASLKMTDTDGNVVPTHTFMDVAERTGYAAKLDLWTLQECFKATVQALPKHPNLKVLVRLSNCIFDNPKFWQLINKMAKDLNIPQNTVVFELSYDGIKSHIEGVKAFINNVKQSGCLASVHSAKLEADTLSAIQGVPLSLIKFDKQSTEMLLGLDEEEKAEIKTLFETIKSTGLSSVLTNVQDPMAMSVVWTSGCDYMQGDFIGEGAPNMAFDFANAMG